MPDLFDVGRTALLEITSAESIGSPAGSIDEGEGVTTVYFETTLSGYPGWRWTVSIADLEGEEPSVLETELTPGDGALLSPAWVPWVDRLADYKAAQELLEAEAPDADDDESDDEDDDEDDDDLGSDILHGGDVDGVDIDEEDDSDFGVPDEGVDESEDAEDDSDDEGPEDPTAEESAEEEHDHHEGD